jgi:hypothetical protein
MKNALDNWVAINEAMRTCTEKEALKLMEKERAGENRVRVLIRIHSRMNKLRADRERREIMGGK